MKKLKMRFTPEVSHLVAKRHPENERQLKQAWVELRQNPFIGIISPVRMGSYYLRIDGHNHKSPRSVFLYPVEFDLNKDCWRYFETVTQYFYLADI
jgi:hypothetical protein